MLSCKKGRLIGISEICGRMKMSRREVLACLKQLTAQGYVKIEEKNICVCLTELGGSGARNDAIAMKPSPSFWNM